MNTKIMASYNDEVRKKHLQAFKSTRTHTNADKTKKPFQSESYKKNSLYSSQKILMAGGLEQQTSKQKASQLGFCLLITQIQIQISYIYKKGGLAIVSCWVQPLIQGTTLMLEAAFLSGLASRRSEAASAHLASSCWRERNSMSWTKSRITFGMLQEMCIFQPFY